MKATAGAVGVVVIAALAACASNSRRPAASLATETPRGDCGTCHAAIAQEHDRSMHAVAFSDRTFQESLSLEAPEEHAFCTNCHGPDGAARGVGCASCHVAPHSGRAPAAAASPDGACVSCHEFAFDGGRAELVQKTMTEHRASLFADVSCTSCHMPRQEGHASHRFPSAHEPARIASAVHVEATWARPGVVVFTIRADVGHAFPSGDMFRRARLEVFGDGRDGAIVADAERTFGRTWTGIRDGARTGARTQARDTRIFGVWSEEIALSPSAPLAAVRWRLVFERVIAMRGPHVKLASSDVVAAGELR